MTRIRRAAGATAGACLAVALAACGPANAPGPAPPEDPVRHDPREVDARYPPTMAGLSFTSEGATLNGQLYQAGGPGPHPTIVLLHGFPGHEKNLDLAQAARRAGYNVLFFHYRGAWGSEGAFDFEHVVEDVGAALSYLRDAETRERFRIDSERLILVGHSMGGFAALAGAARDRDVACVAAIAPWNVGAFARELAAGGAEARDGFAATLEAMPALDVPEGGAVVATIVDRQDDFDPTRMAGALEGKAVLLVGAAADGVLDQATDFEPLVAAYGAEPAIALKHVTLDGDHAFSWTRIALIETVLDWLRTDCAGD